MAETVRIASTLPMALQIREPETNPEKPGLTAPLRTAVLNGRNAPGAGALGVTEMDADLWNKWSKSEEATAYMEHLRVLGEGEDAEADQYGFEPALEAAEKGEARDPAAASQERATVGANSTQAAPVASGSAFSATAAPVAAQPAVPIAGKTRPAPTQAR